MSISSEPVSVNNKTIEGIYMSHRFISIMTILVALCISTIAHGATSPRGKDLTEFKTTSDAEAFGWKPAQNTNLTITKERKVGRGALRIQAKPGVKEYSGADLDCMLDLTGAGPKDKLVFFVKQNYGTGLRVQMWTEDGPVNRSFTVKHGGWTRVELDLDINHWENPQAARWGVITRIQFYEKGFNDERHYMILDGMTITARGQRVSPAMTETITSWKFPQETTTGWRIGTQEAAWEISKTTGQVTGGWNVRTKTPYLLSLVGRYQVEDRRSKTTAIENEDVVKSATFDADEQRIEITCSNQTVPNLIIKKQYWIRNNKLFHRIAFSTTSDELQFITYNAQTHFESSYRNSGYYMGGADGGGPLIPAPQVSVWRKVTQHQNTPKGMVLSQPDLGYSFAHVRTRLDNNFVWPWFTGAIASYCEPVNIMHYTPDGWDISLGTSKLFRKNETSYEQYLTIFEGDWQQFLQAEYSQLPEVQEALNEIPPTPKWVSNVIADTLSDLTRLERLLEVTDEGNIMVLVDLGGSWADYYVDQGLEGGWGGGSIEAEEIRDLIQRIKGLSPRIKVGIYMWVLSTTEDTRIFRDHPEYFRITNKEGEKINTFPGVMTNYAHLLSIPESYNELLSQFDLVLDYLDTDFIYLDDPKAINPVDWSSGEYTRDDLSFQFMLDIKRIAASHGPDKMVFFNNRGNPYADVNYIEARSTLDANYWRQFTGIAAVIQEFISSTRPDARIVPLYYIPPHDRDYINRVLALGWIPEVGNSSTDQLLERRAFVQAIYEMGNSAAVPARYSPDWKRDKETAVESYAVQRRGDVGYLLSFIDHNDASRVVPVEVDLTSLSLPRDGQIYVWQYAIENANEYKGTVTEGMAREAYTNAGWILDHVTQRKLVYCGPYVDTISIDMSTDPLLLNQLYITSQPAAIYAENNLAGNYLFNQKPRVSLQDTTDWNNGTIEIQVESERDEAQIIAFLPLSRYRMHEITVDGQPAETELVFEGDDVYPVVRVGHGSHTIHLDFEETTMVKSTQVNPTSVQVTSDGVYVTLPGSEEALITIERNGHVIYKRVTQRSEDNFYLPLATTRSNDGDYTVTLRATIGNDGQVRLATSAPIAITLPPVAADARLIAKRQPIMPGTRQINDVNREIDGVRVLRSAVMTTNTVQGTFQPNLDALMARVDPDQLLLEAGTTRKIETTTRGAAFAGLEIANLRKIEVSLSNTFYNAFNMFGKDLHLPPWNTSTRPFAGIVVDYHTPAGYTKRVSLATGVIHSDCSSVYPDYGKAEKADEYYDMGKALIESPEQTFTIDLERFAPDGWDGQVWISVGSDWVASDRRLTMRILAANDAATNEPRVVADPRMIMEAFMKPKTLHVPRSPGGIIIDGPSDEEWWRGAAITDQFFLHNGEGLPKANTITKLLYDDDNLFIAFVCKEPSRHKPLTQSSQIWDDDEVEVWLDINRDSKTYTQILINSANTKEEYNEKGPHTINATSATYVAEGDAWMVEMAIPFSSLGIDTPKPGDTWRISLCRYRPGGDDFNTEVIVWAPLQNDGFKDLANFGTLIFDK